MHNAHGHYVLHCQQCFFRTTGLSPRQVIQSWNRGEEVIVGLDKNLTQARSGVVAGLGPKPEHVKGVPKIPGTITWMSEEDEKPNRPVELIVIRGLPGSGKSTLAAEKYPDYLHYEPDHLISDTRGRYRFDDQFFGEAQTFVRHLADFALARGESVVVSDVFPLLAEVEPYERLAEAHGALLRVIDCMEQFGNCHRVPVMVLDRMREQFEPWPADGVVIPDFLKRQAD